MVVLQCVYSLAGKVWRNMAVRVLREVRAAPYMTHELKVGCWFMSMGFSQLLHTAERISPAMPFPDAAPVLAALPQKL